MTVEPSWPTTPSGSGRWPARSQATSAAMIAAAMTRFAVMTRRARRDSVMMAGMAVRSGCFRKALIRCVPRPRPASGWQRGEDRDGQ